MHRPQTLRPLTRQPSAGDDAQSMGAGSCPCHDALDCPDPVSVALDADTLAELSELCGTLDEFLRCGNGAAELLADFYATHHRDAFPRYAANLLIDQVGFTAASLRHHLWPEGGGGHR